VISGKVAAGSVDSIVFSEIPEENRAGLIVLGETKNVPRHLVIVRSGMSPVMIEAIKKLLLDIDKTPEGKDILTKFQKTAKFDDAPGGIEAGLTQIRDLYKLTSQKR
jgi:phosphonate transport system substrate-binding protein